MGVINAPLIESGLIGGQRSGLIMVPPCCQPQTTGGLSMRYRYFLDIVPWPKNERRLKGPLYLLGSAGMYSA